MPQPSTNPTPASAPAHEPTPAERQIERAKTLEKERATLMEKISANRTYLRLMASNDELSADQVKWLNVFYPEKERGERRSAADIEATRKAREAARKPPVKQENGAAA